MGKKILIDWQSSVAALIDPKGVVSAAGDLAEGITQMRCRRPGDLVNAMRSVEAEYGVPYSVLWALRYRRDRVKDVAASVFFKLRSAYEAECTRQIRKLEHETYVARQLAGSSDPGARAAELVVGHARKARGLPAPVRFSRRVGDCP